MSNRLEFNASFVRLVSYFIVTNGFIMIIVLIFDHNVQIDSMLLLFGCFNGYYFISLNLKPFRIIVDQQENAIEIYYLWIFNRPKVACLNEVQCSYDVEVGARGMKNRVLRIVDKGQTVAKLIRGFNGFDEESLRQICERINEPKTKDDQVIKG